MNPPSEFLHQMAEIAEESGTLRAETYYDTPAATRVDVVCFDVPARSEHKGMFGQLIHSKKHGTNVQVEARARCWKDTDFPSYTTYVRAIRIIFDPLLSAYNQKHRRKLRLKIQRQDEVEPKLSPTVRAEFDSFVNGANKNGLHPFDWRRFYLFAKSCHGRRVRTNEEDVFRLLVTAGFPADYARDLASVFGHLRDFQRYG